MKLVFLNLIAVISKKDLQLLFVTIKNSIGQFVLILCKSVMVTHPIPIMLPVLCCCASVKPMPEVIRLV